MKNQNQLTPVKFNNLSNNEKDKFINQLKYLYFEQNLSRDKVIQQMNITISCLKHVMKLYNLKKDKKLVQQNINKTFLDKYGKIGFVNPEKSKQTMIERYGVDNALKISSVKEKIKQTNNERYGGNAPACDPRIQEKMQQTCLKRYGVKNIRLNANTKQSIKEKMSKTIQEKYGVPYYCLTEDCISKQGKTISKVNRNFAKLLDANNIQYKQEYVLENKSYDFKIENILVEINPTYTHNSTIGPYFKNHKQESKDSNYHLDKTLLASKYNFRCIHVFDNDDWNKIIYLLQPKQKVYARNCIITEVPIKECNEFLNSYHLQNACRNQKIRLGLYFNNKLVQIMTFGKPRYNKNYEYELLRLCSHKDYIIIGGSEKLFKHFVNEYNPQNIISYCDYSKFSGDVYKRLGMEFKNLTKPIGNWFNLESNDFITESLLKQRGFDQLFGTNYGKGTSNAELMIQHGWVQVYNCGQSIYSWNK